MVRTLSCVAAAALLAVTFACGDGDKPVSPTSPTGVVPAESDAAADGSTLKVTAPEPVSPAANAVLEDLAEAVLRVNPATTKFTNSVSLTYRFQLLQGSTVVRQSASTASRNWTLTGLESDTVYGWRARAELGAAFGPWSDTRSFRTPETPSAYNRPGELYDPLVDGKTIGKRFGSTAFVGGKGIRINGHSSMVEYTLPRTITSGEFSLIATNVRKRTPGAKTKMMAMRDGWSDIITNRRRVTVEKRDSGRLAWRLISSSDQVDSTKAQRLILDFRDEHDYLWVASWRNNRFQVQVYQGTSPSGKLIYSMGEHFTGTYNPRTHNVYVGAPIGRSGTSSASVPNVIVRHVWVSSRARPSFANK